MTPKVGDFWFWKSVLGARDTFLSCCKRKLGNDTGTRFWEDRWFGDVPFSVKYAKLYNITTSKNISVAKALEQECSNIKFKRSVCGEGLVLWNRLLAYCNGVILKEESDSLVWMLSPSGTFSVKSFYNFLRMQSIAFPHNFIWDVKLPLRLKIFLWLVMKRSILTKDNLGHRGWMGDKKCMLCGAIESIDHLFL